MWIKHPNISHRESKAANPINVIPMSYCPIKLTQHFNASILTQKTLDRKSNRKDSQSRKPSTTAQRPETEIQSAPIPV